MFSRASLNWGQFNDPLSVAGSVVNPLTQKVTSLSNIFYKHFVAEFSKFSENIRKTQMTYYNEASNANVCILRGDTVLKVSVKYSSFFKMMRF